MACGGCHSLRKPNPIRHVQRTLNCILATPSLVRCRRRSGVLYMTAATPTRKQQQNKNETKAKTQVMRRCVIEPSSQQCKSLSSIAIDRRLQYAFDEKFSDSVTSQHTYISIHKYHKSPAKLSKSLCMALAFSLSHLTDLAVVCYSTALFEIACRSFSANITFKRLFVLHEPRISVSLFAFILSCLFIF